MIDVTKYAEMAFTLNQRTFLHEIIRWYCMKFKQGLWRAMDIIGGALEPFAYGNMLNALKEHNLSVLRPESTQIDPTRVVLLLPATACAV